jgi:membrane associated rhomboid family serine protease
MTKPKIEDSILKDTQGTILIRYEVKDIVKARRNQLIMGVVMAILCVEFILLALEPSPIDGAIAVIFGLVSYLFIRGSRLNNRILQKAYQLTKEDTQQ